MVALLKKKQSMEVWASLTNTIMHIDKKQTWGRTMSSLYNVAPRVWKTLEDSGKKVAKEVLYK